jgi:phage shock protein B
MGSEVIVIPAIFLGMPWIIMHYLTKWKQAPKITQEDENLLDEMYNLARRLEDRMNTVERIVAADNPEFKPGLNAPHPDWQQSMPARTSFTTDRRN